MLSPANVFSTIVICVKPWSNSWLFHSYHFTIKAEMINIHRKKNRFPHSKSSFLFLLGENQAFCIHYTDQLEPVWGARMYICESDTNTSLWLSERNGKHAHIPSMLTFFYLAFCPVSPVSCGGIKSRMAPLNKLDFCAVGKIELHPFCHCESSRPTWFFLMDSSH